MQRYQHHLRVVGTVLLICGNLIFGSPESHSATSFIPDYADTFAPEVQSLLLNAVRTGPESSVFTAVLRVKVHHNPITYFDFDINVPLNPGVLHAPCAQAPGISTVITGAIEHRITTMTMHTYPDDRARNPGTIGADIELVSREPVGDYSIDTYKATHIVVSSPGICPGNYGWPNAPLPAPNNIYPVLDSNGWDLTQVHTLVLKDSAGRELDIHSARATTDSLPTKLLNTPTTMEFTLWKSTVDGGANITPPCPLWHNTGYYDGVFGQWLPYEKFPTPPLVTACNQGNFWAGLIVNLPDAITPTPTPTPTPTVTIDVTKTLQDSLASANQEILSLSQKNATLSAKIFDITAQLATLTSQLSAVNAALAAIQKQPSLELYIQCYAQAKKIATTKKGTLSRACSSL